MANGIFDVTDCNRALRASQGEKIQPVEVEPGVSVQQQEVLVQSILCVNERSARAQRLRLDGNVDTGSGWQARLYAVCEFLHDRRFEACEQENIAETSAKRFVDQSLSEWNAADL